MITLCKGNINKLFKKYLNLTHMDHIYDTFTMLAMLLHPFWCSKISVIIHCNCMETGCQRDQ